MVNCADHQATCKIVRFLLTSKETLRGHVWTWFLLQVREGQANSVAVLERFLPHTRSIHLPSMHSFGVPDEKTNTVEHNWKCGQLVSAAEITYLVSRSSLPMWHLNSVQQHSDYPGSMYLYLIY